MNVSSIGIQLVQTGTATQQKSSAVDSAANDRVAPAAPATSSLPAGVGQQVDKTA